VTAGLTCDDVRNRELIERYAAGTLGEAEADALEAHAFGCEACWAEMQRAVELHAALMKEASGAIGVRRPNRVREWRRLVGLAAAAILVLSVAVGWYATHRPDGGEDIVIRGSGGELTITAEWQRNSSLRLTWPTVAQASRYRVEVLSSNAEAVIDHTTTPEFVVPANRVADLRDPVVTVEAEDNAGMVIARGRLTPPDR
jgi:hypothetical protein